MTLTRESTKSSGVFGILEPLGLHTLEHAYPTGDGFKAKLPTGTYTCKRGMHKLHDGVPFETFEIMGVPGHTGILFHVGNFNSDSEGCVLLGLDADHTMVRHSKPAFAKFMEHCKGINEFTLEVR